LTEQTTPRDDAGRFTGAAEHRAVEVSDAMSKAVDSDARPADAFRPMPMANPEPPKESTFDDSVQGLRSAAEELQERRRQKDIAPTQRLYQDKQTGVRRPPTETRKLSEAAADLKNLRNLEADAAIAHSNDDLASRIDQFRAERDAQDVLAEHYAKQQPEVPTPQPEAAPEAAPVNGVDPELARMLENPKLRDAVNQQIQQSEIARQQYMAALHQVSQIQAAAITNQFPEMAGVTQETLPAALNAINARDPARAQAIVNHLQATSRQIEATNQQIRAEQQRAMQQAAQQFERYSKESDSEFEDFKSSRPPGEAKAVNDRVINFVTRELGVDENTLRQLWNSNPIIRSPQMQKMLYMATAYSIAKESASQRAAAPVPKVMRPGESFDRPSGESAVVTEKMRQFAADPNPRSAAKALAARRRAASVLR
jgi:hypothetical protein